MNGGYERHLRTLFLCQFRENEYLCLIGENDKRFSCIHTDSFRLLERKERNNNFYAIYIIIYIHNKKDCKKDCTVIQ